LKTSGGYSLNIDSANYYLKLAGYPNGEGFPVLQFLLNAEGDRNVNVAVEIKKQLKDHLNCRFRTSNNAFCPAVGKSFSGDYAILRAAWVADYPSAENFLWIFSSKDVPDSFNEASYPNIARYVSASFDAYYESALKAKSIEDANALFKKAEQELMADAPIVVLWYDEGYRLIKSHIADFPNNPMQYRDLGRVYFKQAETL
jgi:oligopeptide transport system substrate-binding protein